MTDTPPPLREVLQQWLEWRGHVRTATIDLATDSILASAEVVALQRRADFGYDGPRTVPADCTHYCEEGHYSGDDMTMLDIQTHSERERLRERVAALEAALDYLLKGESGYQPQGVTWVLGPWWQQDKALAARALLASEPAP